MSAYQQLGDKSANLLSDSRLTTFRGAVLSPVNYTEQELTGIVTAVTKQRSSFDSVFDPQLYFPKSQRGVLQKWSHLPNDVDTADLSDESWWTKRVDAVIAVAGRVGATAVCSPAVVPKSFSDDYYARTVNAGSVLHGKAVAAGRRALQTAVVSFPDLADPERAFAIASILSQGPCGEIYLVLTGDTEPRRELREEDELRGALTLIHALRSASLQVFVAFASSDVVLWKAAGATHCGTGKYFNLRRFTQSRFDEPSEGGGQLPYWFEESLMAFLREGDLVRVERAQLLSAASRSNPFAAEILEEIKNPKARNKTKNEEEKKVRAVWIGLARRQYLSWFASIEERLDDGDVTAEQVLDVADKNWETLDRAKFRMEERGNDGKWIRLWWRALQEYPR
jgi:hypothetical protein